MFGASYLDLDEIKQYCHIDTDDPAEEWLINSFKDAAVEYLASAGVPYPEDGNIRYKLCVYAIVLELYDRRGMTESVTPSAIPGMSNMVVQLKLEAEAERIAGDSA